MDCSARVDGAVGTGGAERDDHDHDDVPIDGDDDDCDDEKDGGTRSGGGDVHVDGGDSDVGNRVCCFGLGKGREWARCHCQCRQWGRRGRATHPLRNPQQALPLWG